MATTKKKAQASKTKPKSKTKTVKDWLKDIGEGSADLGPAFMRADAKLRGEVIKAVAARVTARRDDDLWTLSYMEKDERALDAIVAITKKAKGTLKGTALAVLGSLNKKHDYLIPIFVEALSDPTEDVRDEGVSALENYATTDGIEPLKALLVRERKKRGWSLDYRYCNIMSALAVCGKGRDDVIDILTEHLEPDDRFEALPIYDALIEMKKKAKRAVPKLEAVAENSVEIYLSTLARRALISITGDPAPHIKALKAATKIRDSATRSIAKRAVAEVAALSKKPKTKKK